jgi:toxin ParE1/3/4
VQVRWTPAAAADLQSISDYLIEHLPSLSHSTINQVYDAIRSLKSMPNRGRRGAEPGTRELVVTRLPYIVVYRVKDEAVEILRILHAAQSRRSSS